MILDTPTQAYLKASDANDVRYNYWSLSYLFWYCNIKQKSD